MAGPSCSATCASIWLSERRRPGRRRLEAALADAAETGQIVVSPITAWEESCWPLGAGSPSSRPPLAWFETLVRLGVALAPMPPSVLVDSSFLPAPAPRDPADRIIAATGACVFSYRGSGDPGSRAPRLR